MAALVVIGGVVGILALLGILAQVEDGRRKRMIADVTRPTRHYDLAGDLLPREETSLGPVDYRRVPAAVGYVQTTQTARHTPTVTTSVVIPALTAMGTALALTLAMGALAWAFGWPAKTVLIVFALSLALGWFWRLGFADKVLWAVESWTGKDLDHDQVVGKPALGYATINPGQARATVARETTQQGADGRLEALQAFVDRCYLAGTSESAHGIQASGPDRDNYVACREVLFSLGLAAWRNPERPRGGWVLVTDPVTAKTIIAQHAI